MKRFLAIFLAVILLLSSFPMGALKASSGTESRGQEQRQALPRKVPYNTGNQVVSNQWPTGNFPLMPNYSGLTPNATGSTGLRYKGTVRDNDGEYLNIEIIQVGKVYDEDVYSSDQLKNAVGWSHLVLHFDPVLFANVDLDKSSITGTNGTFYLSNRAKGAADKYKTDDYSVSVPLIKVFKDYWTPQEDQRATFKLYLKKDHSLADGASYLIEHRTMAQSNDLYSQIYIRDYIMGIENTNVRAFDAPAYMQYTGSLSVPYNVTYTAPKYSSYRQDVMSNAYSDVYIDWNTNELHVNYVYETTEDILAYDRTQFVQLFTEKLKGVLAPRNGVYAKFNHVYKRGDLAWGNDRGITFTDLSSFAGTNAGQAGFRLRIPKNDSSYNHPWIWVTETTTAYGSNLSASNGRYMAYSKTHGPIANHMVYYIDPDKFLNTFDNLDDLKFDSFFVTRDNNEVEGGVLKNSECINSLAITKNMTNSPQIDDIYTDSQKITGNTGYNNADSKVSVTAKNFKNPQNSKTQLVNTDGKIEFYPANFDGVFDNMQKDDKLSFETIYRYANYYKSRPTIEKVKARIYFDKYDGGKDLVVTVPSSDKFRGDAGYVENGLGVDNMPANPTKEGYIFKGWSTKQTTASDFAKAEKLTKVDQWNEGKAYIFDGTVPVNKSYRVYPVWEEENKGFTIVLHSNDGTDRKEEIKIAYDEKLPSKTLMDSFKSQDEQNGEVGKAKYSRLSTLPNAYDVNDGKEKGIFDYRAGYNLVGWSTDANNSNVKIEDLFSNAGILAREGEGKTAKYYLTTVRTKAQGIGQAAAAKLFNEITIDTNNEVHLYAAWKPYFNIELTKQWYDSTAAKFKNKTVKEILQLLAHGDQTQTPAQDASLAEPIQIGLLYRTAVTEANDPTITGEANYYLVNGSLQRLDKNGAPLKWTLPSYDRYGKRLSYIAVEFEDTPEGIARYNAFGQKWTNIWATVADNLHKKPGEVWDNESISKVQSLIVPKANGDVDAFSGATVRKLYEDGTPITETQANNSTVGTTPSYKTTFYNLKVEIANPTFLKMYEGDKVVRLKAPDDPRVQVVEFDLPEVAEKIIFKRDDADRTVWKRVTANAQNKWDESYKIDYTLVETNHNGNKVLELKLDLEGKNKYKYLKAGQDVAATYYALTQNEKSGTTVEKVNAKKDAPSLEGLRQDVLEEIDGEEYVIIKATKPTLELGQLQAGAVIKLIDASINKGEENQKAYKNLDGSPVLAELIGGEYVFKVPKSANPGLVDGTNVAAYVEQEGSNPSRSKVPCKLDLKGPDITAPELTIYTGEDVDVKDAVITDEEATLLSNAGLDSKLKLNKDFNTLLGKKWKLSGKAKDTVVRETVTLLMEDKFGNKTNQAWIINYVDRPTSNNVSSAVQIPNKISSDYKDYEHKIKLTGATVGATIKVYLTEPTNPTVVAPVSITCTAADQEIFISQGIGTNIGDKVWLTQTQTGKKESKALVVPMDVKAPNSPSVKSLVPGQGTLTLTGITDDTTKIYINLAGRERTLTRDKDHADLWKDERFNPITMKNNDELTIDLTMDTRPGDNLRVVALDNMLNPKSDTKEIEDYKTPDAPTIVAENKGDGMTTVTGTSKNPGATVTIYEVKEETDPSTGEVTVKRTFKGTAKVDNNGNYTVYIKPEEKVGTELGAVVTEHGKESPMATTTVTENAGIIPFDPDDPTPNPDKDRYVTVTLDPNGGSFKAGTKSSFYVLKTYEVKATDFDKALLGLEAPANKAFDKWTEVKDGNIAFTAKKFTENATIYASYKANDNVIPFDPKDPNPTPNPDPNKYVTVSLNANGGKFAQGTKSSFYVKKTYTMTTNDFAIAEKGLTPPTDKAFNAWALDKDGNEAFPAQGKAFDKDASVFAQYREGRDVIPGTGNDKPDGYVTVTFKADATQATLEGETTYYVNPKGNVKLGGILAPTIKPATGYAVSYPAWTYSDNQNAASIVIVDTTATASLYDKDKVIPVQDGVEVTKPAGYLDVVFNAGDNGKLEGTSKFYVKPGTPSKDVPAPTPIPNTGYKVKAEAWDPLIPTTYDKDFTTTAQYEALPPISDKPQAGYVMVQFDGGDHGKVTEDNGNKTIIFVNPEVAIALDKKAPTVKEDINWSFDKWSIDGTAVDLSKATKYTKETIIKATYTSDISGESKDGFVLVQFKAGDKGVIETGNANVYVKKDKEVDLTAKAPKIKANEGYVHTGWDKPLKGIFADTTEINAKYTDPSDISTKPVDGFKHITFKDGDHVKIADKAIKEYWVNPAKVVSVPAPDVVVDAGYVHNGWSANLTQQFKQDTEITPTSMESTDVTPNKNENYTEIKFVAGNHGKFASIQGPTYSLWANPAKVVTIQAPAIDADQGWKLTGWLKSGDTLDKLVKVGAPIKGQFPKANGTVQYIAQYEALDDISDKPEKGYVAISFNAGSNAHFEGQDSDKRIITYYVNPAANKSLRDLLKGTFAEPNLVYDEGYEKGKTKWTPDLVLDLTVDAAQEYTANVKSKGQLPGDTTPVPKNWKTVEFKIFDYDKDAATITGGIKKYLVDPKETVTLKAPDVKITKEGYSLDGWNHSLRAKFEQDTIIYALIGGDISTKPKDGFVKVTFAPGTNGKFEDGATTELYVRKNTKVDLAPRAPKVIPQENYSHSGWTFGGKPYGTDSIKVIFSEAENTITATYDQDIIDNPNTPNPPEGYARVIFKPGDHGSFAAGYKANFDVRIAAKLTIGDLNKPKVIAKDGFFFTKWDKDNNTQITASMDVTAQYSGDIIPGTDPNTPVKPGYVRITFAPGTDGKFKEGEPTFYDVRKDANKTLKDLGKPTVIANSGYTHTGWDKKDETKLDQTMIVLALYNRTIIDNPNTPNPPAGYVRVTFDATDKGTITAGTAVQDVLIAANKTLGDLSKPTVQGKDGNVFSGWDTKDDTKLDKNLTVTALYNDDIKEVDDPNSPIPKGYARVVFKAGEHGSFESTAVTAYDVLMKKDVKRTLGEVKKPKVIAEDGYTFKAWDKADTEELIEGKKLEVTATYNQNVIISDDPSTPIPDGYVRATFKTEGSKGAIEATINGDKKTLETVVMDVLPKTKTVGELKTNITLTAKDGNVFEGWSKPDDYLVAANVTIEAQYQGGQTNTPSATALNVGKNNFTTITGTAEAGATVVARVKGEVVGKATADANGDYTIKATKGGNKLPDRTKVSITATKAPLSESKPQTAIVLPDANGDGIPDGDLDAPKAPIVTDPKTDDTKVTVKLPKEEDAKKIVIKVTEKDGNTVTTVEVIKDGDIWKVGGQALTPDDRDRIAIPLPNTELKEDQKVIANVYDESNNESQPTIKTVTNKDQLAPPEIDTPHQDDIYVSGKAPGAATVDIVVRDKNGKVVETKNDVPVSNNGTFNGKVLGPLKDGEKVTVIAHKDGFLDSEASKKVGLELDKIKATDKEAKEVIDKAKQDNNWAPANNHFDKNLDEKKKAAEDVIKAAEDADDNNDPSQDDVDTAEKELRDALNKKDADTKVTKVEDAVKNGEKPSPEDIKVAQDAIDKIDGSTVPNAEDFDKDKKELQDRLDKAKLIDDLKDKVDNAPKDDDKHPEYKTKPEEVKKELEDAKKEAEKVIDDYKNDTNTADKTPEQARDDLDTAIDNYNKERVVVSIAIPSGGFNGLIISSLQENVKIKIFVDGQEQLPGKDIYTSPAGKLVVTLDKPLTSGQKVEIIGTKAGLLDGGATVITP